MEGLGVFRAIQCLTPEGWTIAERSSPDFTAVHESAVPAPADQNDGQETRCYAPLILLSFSFSFPFLDLHVTRDP